MAEPNISDFLTAAMQAVRGYESSTCDYTRGSDYEMLTSGPTAILWARQMRRDAELFASGRFADAAGPDLGIAVEGRGGPERVAGTRGTGHAIIKRTSGGTSGTFWKGTRIEMRTGYSERILYRITDDVAVTSSALDVRVEVEADKLGKGVRASDAQNCRLVDATFDSGWVVSRLTCSDGVEDEAPEDYRERTRQLEISKRYGHLTRIKQVCFDAGAANVIVFRSNYAGAAADAGLNVCYVGDVNYETSAALQAACRLGDAGCRSSRDQHAGTRDWRECQSRSMRLFS